MSLKKITIAAIFLLSLVQKIHSQQRIDLDLLAGRFIKYVRSDKKEKIIVLTDKEFYRAGETVWLKAWCLDSLSNHFLQKSKNLYVDLVDDSDKVASQLIFSIAGGRTNGKLQLPRSLKEGYYWLRGYTINILQQDSGRIFVKPLYVINPTKPDSSSLLFHVPDLKTSVFSNSDPEIVFFPEGGSIIGGTTALIAFTSKDSLGQPLEVSGYITDTKNDTVARFKTSRPGIGEFKFDAFNPRKYFAHIKWNSKEIIYPLPHLNQYGSQLSVLEQNGVLRVRVNQGDSVYKKKQKTYILGVSRDSLCFAAYGTDMYEATVSKENFPQGKATFFLFNDQFKVLSQRSLYIENTTSQVEVRTDKTVYGARERVKLDVSVSDQHHQPVLAIFSISVVAGEPAENSPQSVSFVDQRMDQLLDEQIDATMISQKGLYSTWRFDDTAGIAVANFKQDDSGLLDIRGRIVSNKNIPLNKSIINLFSQDRQVFKIDTIINDGRFHIEMQDFYDSTKFDLKLTNLKGQTEEGKIILDRFEFPQFPTPRKLKAALTQSLVTTIKKYSALQMADTSTGKELLKSVKITAQKKIAPNYDASKRVSIFSDIITSDRLNKGDRFAIVNAITANGGFNTGVNSVDIGASMTSSGALQQTVLSEGGQPLLVMDGVILTMSSESVGQFLTHIEQGSIDFIELLKGPQTAIYGIQGANGVILINTNKIDRSKAVIEISGGVSTIFPKGYCKPSVFVGPDYDKPEVKKTPYPDMRSTIWWQDKAYTDKDGKATLYFYTADAKSAYNILVRGVDEKGDIFSKTLTIERQ
jgi:TonB-dependent SusC/RagA subfamily outer membrane receptor